MAAMRQLTFQGAGKLDWLEVPEPALTGRGDALVRPVAVATCDLDTPIVRGETPFGGPLPLGHECVAEVVDVADGVEGLEEGALVTVPFQISCGECERCRRGHTAHCESVPWQSAYGLPPHGESWGGFLSDLVRVPYAEHMLVALPGGVDPGAAASVSDNIVDAWRTVGPQLAGEPEAAVLIVGGGGPGSLGLYAAGIAAALGGSRVVYVDKDERRRRIASELGAETIAEPERRLGPFPITVDASADPAGLGLAIRSTASEGVCTSVGIYFQNEVSVPLFEAYVTGITFQTGRVHARPAIPEAMELIASGRLHPELVTTRIAGWEESPAALREGEFVKLVLTREPDGPRS
jgi:threonine dehydrogenase-like Zn-dependent dehydrogenase